MNEENQEIINEDPEEDPPFNPPDQCTSDDPPFLTDEEREARIDVQDNRKWTFTIIENAILENEKVTRVGLLTYIVLCYHANSKDHSCFPSIKTIAKEARLGESSVRTGLKELEELGIISVLYRKDPTNPKNNLSNLYTIKGVVQPLNQGGSCGEPGVVQPLNPNNNNKELDPLNNNRAVAALFQKTFSCTLPEDVLLNPHFQQAVDYMVEYKNPAEVNNPVGLIIHLLRNPEGIPERDPDPEGIEKHHKQSAKRRRDMEQAFKDREQQVKDPEQVKKIHEMVKGVCGKIPTV